MDGAAGAASGSPEEQSFYAERPVRVSPAFERSTLQQQVHRRDSDGAKRNPTI